MQLGNLVASSFYRCAGPNCGMLKRTNDRWWLMWTSAVNFNQPVQNSPAIQTLVKVYLCPSDTPPPAAFPVADATGTTVALAAPTALLTIPFFDTAAAILRRKLTGRSIYTTDRGHLHHCLQRRGLSNRWVLLWVSLFCFVTVCSWWSLVRGTCGIIRC